MLDCLRYVCATESLSVVEASLACNGCRILEQAPNDGIALIAMATHARQGLARVLLGSVAETVLREARVPVLLYHPAT
jgi:hypothetical protein